jgi:hypothetical protein
MSLVKIFKLNYTVMQKSWFVTFTFLMLNFLSVSGQERTNDISVGSDGLHGYISFSSTKPPEGFGAGISFYSAVWPLVHKPYADFQIGLPGTWVIPENSGVGFPLCPVGTLARDNWPKRGPTWGSVFQTIEGGLGYWAGNRFRYGPPKFSMNGTPSCYDLEIASPGWSFFYSATALPDNKMGIAQLSNRILVPPDGFTFINNPDGKFLGYAWMALSFMNAKPGPPPTGDQSWTLFLNSANFKGPVAYYIPETWSKISKNYHADYSHGLDTRPGVMGGGAMEINTVPRMDEKRSGDTIFYKIPKLFFPIDNQGRSVLVRDVKYYNKKALYNSFKDWKEDKGECSGSFDKDGTWEPVLTTQMPGFDQKGIKLSGIDNIFTTEIFSDNVFGMQWKDNSITNEGEFPQYFMQVGKGPRVPVSPSIVPIKLKKKEFKLAEWGSPYTSPVSGAWITPGPASNPINVVLADGSTVTYCWYRFIDQPSLQQFDWSKEEKEKLQAFVEKIQREWRINKNYMAPPKEGELVSLDPSLIVQPPPGLEVGYVPIVTRQK